MSAIRPSMIALVSTTIAGPVAGGATSVPGRRMRPTAWAVATRSARFATVSPVIPKAMTIETASGAQVPSGAGSAARGIPSRSPIRRPMRRPPTAATNSAVESFSTSRTSQEAGTTVMYGRTANPVTAHATTHAATSAPP